MSHKNESEWSGLDIQHQCSEWSLGVRTSELALSSPARLLIEENTQRFLEFFAANIRNPNTRAAYASALRDFFRWTKAHGYTLQAIQPLHVAAYLEGISGAAQSVKQKLAAIRMLFDWLVTGGLLSTNPAAVVRGPGHVVKVGKTSVLTAQEARTLLDNIPIDNIVGIHDRALIRIMYDQRRMKIWREFWDK